MNYCKLIIGGNLTRDPEVRFTQSGKAICKFGIAVNKKWGEGKERTTFVDVTMFDKRGEAFAKHHKKGDQAFCEGELVLEEWDDKQTGQRRSKLAMTAFEWQFVGGGKRGGPDSPPQQSARPQFAGAQDRNTTAASDEDTPF